LQTSLDEIRASGGEVLAISVDPPERSREIADAYGLDFPLLSDPGARVIETYGVRHPAGAMDGGDIARPAVLVLDREGRVAWREVTDNWRVRVTPERILEALRAIE
jgi:peroxiredoxin